MKQYEFLKTELTASVLTVWMSRPPVNAVNGPMYRELYDLFSTVSTQCPAASAVILAGEGRHFCAGNDLDEFLTMDPANARERMFHVREGFFAIQDCDVPVIGAVHGAALGTGLAIAASCDLVVASDDATFGLPEVGVGVMGGAKHLSRLVPQPMVRRMFFTARAVPARELYRVGGIEAVVPRDELMTAAGALAEEIARHSPTALRVAKKALNAVEIMDLKPGYQYEQGCTAFMSGHPDSKEAINAAREKRPPKYLPYSGL